MQLCHVKYLFLMLIMAIKAKRTYKENQGYVFKSCKNSPADTIKSIFPDTCGVQRSNLIKFAPSDSTSDPTLSDKKYMISESASRRSLTRLIIAHPCSPGYFNFAFISK